jgi:hypothetical protein
MITVSAHTADFMQGIASSGHACILVNTLLTHFGPLPDVEVHFTGIATVDLRVRAFRDVGGGRTEQNIFTMIWRPSGQYFSCKIYSPVTGGGPVSDVRPVNDPLPHAFRFDPAVPSLSAPASAAMVQAIDAAIQQWV